MKNNPLCMYNRDPAIYNTIDGNSRMATAMIDYINWLDPPYIRSSSFFRYCTYSVWQLLLHTHTDTHSFCGKSNRSPNMVGVLFLLFFSKFLDIVGFKKKLTSRTFSGFYLLRSHNRNNITTKCTRVQCPSISV